MGRSPLRPAAKLAGFAVVLVLASAVGAVVGAAVPEQRTGGAGHDRPPASSPAPTTVGPHPADHDDGHGADDATEGDR